ncbi:MAG TPA: hypothetical protein VGH93_08685 [Solirubrobacteraceae bacterium]
MQAHRLTHLASLTVVAAHTSASLAARRLEQAVRPRLKRIRAGTMPPALLLAALAVCAIALPACGSASKPSSSGSADTQALKYADCMRANGVPNFPDPSSNGVVKLPNPASPAFQAAAKACAKLQPAGMPLHGPPAPSAAELRAARAFAQCMRAHTISQFPDPLTTAPTLAGGPEFTLGRGEYFPDPSPTEFQSPAFKQAANACGVQLPAGAP